jgi:hypothetical protein
MGAEGEKLGMKSHLGSHIVAATSLLSALSLVAMPAAAQNGAPVAKPDSVVTNEELQKLYSALPVANMSTQRTADSHPDLSGVWLNPFPAASEKGEDGSVRFDIGIGRARNSSAPPPKYPEPTEPSYKPEYWAKVKAIVDSQYGASTPQDPEYDCKPMGVPRASMNAIQIIQTPKLVAILYESNFIGQTFRVIYTDGHPHPKDLDSSFLGDSIGHWEGDMLVVDVIGLNDETWLGGGQGHTEPPAFGERFGHQIVERYALIHSDQEHVVERYTRHGNLLTYEATVEDPVMFTEPWVVTPRHWFLGGPDDRLLESFCESRDKIHIVKPTQQDHSVPESPVN